MHLFIVLFCEGLYSAQKVNRSLRINEFIALGSSPQKFPYSFDYSYLVSAKIPSLRVNRISLECAIFSSSNDCDYQHERIDQKLGFGRPSEHQKESSRMGNSSDFHSSSSFSWVTKNNFCPTPKVVPFRKVVLSDAFLT